MIKSFIIFSLPITLIGCADHKPKLADAPSSVGVKQEIDMANTNVQKAQAINREDRKTIFRIERSTLTLEELINRAIHNEELKEISR